MWPGNIFLVTTKPCDVVVFGAGKHLFAKKEKKKIVNKFFTPSVYKFDLDKHWTNKNGFYGIDWDKSARSARRNTTAILYNDC